MRRIQAKTLAKLVTRYVTAFPGEAVDIAQAAEPEDGAEALVLLPEHAAWTLLSGIDSRAAARWLLECDDDTLRRLTREPTSKSREILAAGGAALADRIAAFSGQRFGSVLLSPADIDPSLALEEQN
ncbi:MAG: hypothetical protein R2762_20540 [Bryobacteraceae bacterium]